MPWVSDTGCGQYTTSACSISPKVLVLTLSRVDVSSEQSLRHGFDRLKSDFSNALDICIPCAGINRHRPFLEFTYQDHHDLMTINVLGSYFTAQLAAQQMVTNGTQHGSIILVASIASQRAIRSQLCSAYCGSKGAVKAMCPAIAQELAPYVRSVLLGSYITANKPNQGIRVNSISPGYVRTEMTTSVSIPCQSHNITNVPQFPHLLDSWKQEIMTGKVAEPGDLRGACVFLASDASSYMTGQDVVVDGGVTRW